MGYFADIIKDSRLNLAGRRSPVPPAPDLDAKPSAAVTADAEPTPGRPTRGLVGKNPPAVVDARLTPTAPVEPRAVSAEIVKAPQSKAKRLPRVKKSQDIRVDDGSGDDPAGPGRPIEATDAHVALPVMQRETLTTPAIRPSTAPTLSGVRQPDLPSRGRPAVSHPASNRRAASFRPPGAAAVPPVRERPARREAATRRNTRPIEPEFAMIEPEATPVAERSVAPAGQPAHPAAAAPIEAGLKHTKPKPASPVSSMMKSPRKVGNVKIDPAGQRDVPQVQIGQVNVIVEESRVPPKSSPGDQRGDGSASRTFLRSL
jgi:hypothetical protein